MSAKDCLWNLVRSFGPGLVALSLTAACTIEWGSAKTSEAEEEAQPEAPKVRKLYAPGAATGPSEAATEPEAEADADQAAMAAALLGTDRKEAPAETPRPRRANRRRRTPNPDYEDETLEEDTEPGSLSDGAFQSVITDWAGMKRCLAGKARLGPSSGALQVRFVIRGDGQVVKSDVVGATNAAAKAIAPCVERRARRIRFPAFAAATDEIEKTAKFVF